VLTDKIKIVIKCTIIRVYLTKSTNIESFMDKVIVVHSASSNFKGEFQEFEFPEINKALSEGFHINQLQTIVHNNNSAALCYAVVFHLKK
jgi:hypothetical protein